MRDHCKLYFPPLLLARAYHARVAHFAWPNGEPARMLSLLLHKHFSLLADPCSCHQNNNNLQIASHNQYQNLGKYSTDSDSVALF